MSEERRGPGRPPRTEDWSRISFELPARMHDAIIKACQAVEDDSIANWVREACEARLKRQGIRFTAPKKPGDDDLLVG